MEDEKILELFFSRSEQAIDEVAKKYGKTCHNISYNILHSNLDAEECVNDAYLGAWNAIPPAKPNPLLTFLCKIVRNLSLKRYEFNTAIKRNSTYDVAMEELESCLASPDTIEKTLEAKELTRIIENFLDKMDFQSNFSHSQMVSKRLYKIQKSFIKNIIEKNGCNSHKYALCIYSCNLYMLLVYIPEFYPLGFLDYYRFCLFRLCLFRSFKSCK